VAIQDLYRFSQDATSPATTLKNLTSHGGTTVLSIENLSISPDGQYASYTTTTGDPAAVRLWAVGNTVSAAPIALNGAGTYVEPTYAWTGDSKAIVYGGGTTSASALDLLLVKVPSATTTTLHAAQSYIFVVSADQPTP
ncbi:MAG: hypothetical protein KAI47_16330, partial [Deltaproteobacteria bacterium]|nr:hypothetical protein [Deltaproteobacteria bacterium]